MSHEEVLKMIEETGLPSAYDHFVEGEAPEPPFLVFLYPRADNFAADGIAYFKINQLDIELYTDLKQPELEEARARCGLNRKSSMRCCMRWRFDYE